MKLRIFVTLLILVVSVVGFVIAQEKFDKTNEDLTIDNVEGKVDYKTVKDVGNAQEWFHPVWAGATILLVVGVWSKPLGALVLKKEDTEEKK